MHYFAALLSILVLFAGAVAAGQTWHTVYTQPEGVHLSLGVNQTEMIVTWSTMNRTSGSYCKYGIEHMDSVSNGVQTLFVDGGKMKREMYIHRVAITDLKPNTVYRYHCGSDEGLSSMFMFKTLPAGSEWEPRFLIYGDLGNINGRTLGRMTEQVQAGDYDVLLHVGDMAYDLHHDDGLVGDEFLRQIEPIAAYLPYQVCPGNHENAYNFSNYEARFSMHSQYDNNVNNHFWSYNIGPAHVIAFSTEFHYYQQYGSAQIMNQYRWLENDLKVANSRENREKHPWIITMGHRPLYCQYYENEILRVGEHGHPGFEKLFRDYGVDIHFAGHEHNYERMWPIFADKIYNGSLAEPYTEPGATVHITTGSAGCRENHTRIRRTREHFSALVIEDYGFTRMQIHNSSHVHIQQISEDQKGKIVDDFFIVKHHHGTGDLLEQ